jgi:type IV pilus assembly protein PilX
MNKQRGSALILSLLILLVMTMLGITAMSTSTLEEKMAANDRNQKVAFQNAELTLSQTETTVKQAGWKTDIKGALGTDPGFYGEGTTLDYYNQSTWAADSADCSTDADTQARTCSIVQIVAEPPPLEAGGGYGQLNQSNMPAAKLLVTAQGSGANGVTRSMVQSTFEKYVTP